MPAELTEREQRLMAAHMAFHAALSHACALLSQHAIEELCRRLLEDGLEMVSVFEVGGRGGVARQEVGLAVAELAG